MRKLLKKLPSPVKTELKLRRYQWRVGKQDFKRWRKTGFVTPVNRYNIYPEYKLCYIDVPKVASTSIKQMMVELHGLWDQSIDEDPLAVRKRAHEINDQNFKADLDSFNLEDYFVISFVRNPFARLVSTFKNLYRNHNPQKPQIYDVYAFGYLSRKKGIDQDFRRFAKRVCKIPDAFSERHFISQYAILHDRQGRVKTNFVGKMENLNQDWKVVQAKTGLPDLPHHNSTRESDREWMDFYDLDLAKMVYQRYQQDIGLYGYEQDYQDLLVYLQTKEMGNL